MFGCLKKTGRTRPSGITKGRQRDSGGAETSKFPIKSSTKEGSQREPQGLLRKRTEIERGVGPAEKNPLRGVSQPWRVLTAARKIRF